MMSSQPVRVRRRALGTATAVAVLAALAVPLTAAAPAGADTSPPPPTTLTTVASDALPTVQVNGVVWSQVVVGDRVYATGSFSQARPAGAPAGTAETPRSNILAYTLSTGELVTSWAPSLNAQGLTITASPDGSRIFVGGQFTQVSGVTRNRIVALDASTGAVVNPFAASVNSNVRTLAVSNGVLYAGGIFSTSAGQARSRLAAFSASTGALLSWAPVPDREVMAITVPPGTGTVVVGGRFTTLNGVANYGLGALDATTGAALPWPANQVVRNAGDNTGIYHLTSDGTRVYGTGYTFGGGGNLENAFATDHAGNLSWVVGCRGDTYSSMPIGGVLYTVGHAHDCSQLGSFPQTNPWTYQRAIALSTAAGSHGETNLSGNFAGRPAPELLHWLPTLDVGTYTGQAQAAWSVAGNDRYVVLGGEFPRVNYVGQQGLVRFAVKDLSTNKQGPTTPDELTPTVQEIGTGAVRVSWTATWDRDNRRLAYEVLRDGAVVGRVERDSTWWDRPTVAWTDTTAAAGGTASYRIRVKDATNTITGDAATGAGPATPRAAGEYADRVRADGASDYWRLGEAAGGTGFDWSAGRDLVLGAHSRGTAGALEGDPDTATTFAGGTTGIPAASRVRQLAPQHFSVEAWFRTTSALGGKLVGFGSGTTADSATADRHVYLGTDGRLNFGVLQGTSAPTVTSPGAYNDGQWHHVVATLGDGGMRLHVDGAEVAGRPDTTSARWYNGYWRVAGDAISTAFPNRPLRTRFAGDLDEVAVYPVVLDAATALRHWQVGRAVNQAPTAAFTSTTDDLAASFDATGSTDADGTVASYAWTFGDGGTATGATPDHTYTAAGTYDVTLTVTDDDGATGTVTRQVTVTANAAPTAAFTSSTNDLTASFDAATSSDPDGSVASYAWTFGDGGTGTGVSPQRTYAAGGTYDVTLTVTDDDGATASVTRQVTVTPPPAGSTVAQDGFGRTVASGLGTADLGGAWTGGTSTASVGSGTARVSMTAGGTTTLRLPGVSTPSADVRHRVLVEALPTGGGAYLSTIVRATAGGDYRAKTRILSTGAVQVQWVKVVGGTETALTSAGTVPGLTVSAGTPLLVRAQATGGSPTTLRVKVWAASAAEPAAWQQTVTDSTSGLNAAGAVGLVTYLSGSATSGLVARFDDLLVTAL